MNVRTLWLALLASCFALGCGDDGGGKDQGNDGAQGGSEDPACDSWKAAVCDFVDRCGGPAAECREQYDWFACKGDDVATACAKQFRDARCDSPPAGCDYPEVADPAPAIAACDDFVDTTCQRVIECGDFASVDECRPQLGIDCSLAVASSPDLEDCLGDLEVIACEADDLPASCEGAILMAQ